MNPKSKPSQIRALVLCALLATACAQRGEPFARYLPIPAGQARLYLYVEPATASVLAPSLYVVLDGRPLTTLRSGGYVTVPLSPGEHLVVADPSLNVVGHATQMTRMVHLFPDEPMFCGYFPGATERQGRLRCSGDPAKHELMKQCRMAPFERDSTWKP